MSIRNQPALRPVQLLCAQRTLNRQRARTPRSEHSQRHRLAGLWPFLGRLQASGQYHAVLPSQTCGVGAYVCSIGPRRGATRRHDNEAKNQKLAVSMACFLITSGTEPAGLESGYKLPILSHSVIFATQRLVVRSYTEDDVEFVFDMYSRWEVQRFIGATPRVLQGKAEALALIERWRRVSQCDELSGAWAVTLRDSGELVGTAMLKQLPLSAPSPPLQLSRDYEIGWHLHPDHWG